MIEDEALLWADKLDACMMKMIVHEWNDDECMRILRDVLDAASSDSRLFIVEHVIPVPQTPRFSRLFDVHMMCWGTGRERTSKSTPH
mgnify:CR=1 FL=1